MAIANEQLKQIYTELLARFENDRYVKIIPQDGEFSEKYEIKYTIAGVIQDSEGYVNESKDHSILISVPFGFPHFPPSCNPLSQTFHPDFDQEAIGIGDFWNKDRSLSELIIHIGRMIAGEIYSTENSFNEAAADWYGKNKTKLPFEKLSFSPEKTDAATTPVPDDAPIPEITEDPIPELVDDPIASPGFDTLDEADILGSPDYLSLEDDQDEEEISFPPIAQSTSKGPAEEVLLLIRKKHYFEVSSVLATLPADIQLDDREEIEKNVEDVLNQARKLQKEADELEHQGNSSEALQLLEKVEELVPDFPNIQENINRTRKTSRLSDDWNPEDTDQPGSELKDDADDDNADHRLRLAFFDEQRKGTLKIVPILAACICIALVIAFIIPMFTAGSRLAKSEEALALCTKLLTQNKFQQAQKECNSATSILEGVYFFKKNERATLTANIKKVTKSEKMLQGLEGKVLFHGKYVYKKDKEVVLAFEKFRDAGDSFLKQKFWANASEEYLLALNTIKPIQDRFDKETLKTITENYTIAQVNVLLNKGLWFLSAGELDQSSKTLNQARSLAMQLPADMQANYTAEVDSKLNEIKHLQFLELAEAFFASKEWEKAFEQYNKALKLQEETPISEKKSANESLYANMAEAELYALISRGKKAFAQSQWDKAIEHYDNALELLSRKKQTLKQINPAVIEKQLRRVIIRTRVFQSKQIADSKLQKNLYSEAIESYKKVIKVITKHKMEKDEEFSAIYTGTKRAIAEARSNLSIENKIAYLVKNYKQIIQDNYPAAVPQHLKDPKATFVKNVGRKQVFELQCLEKGQGRKLRLVMLYAYDTNTKKWQFYSNAN